MKYHIAIIAEVEAESLEEARQAVYKTVEMKYWKEAFNEWGVHGIACPGHTRGCECGFDNIANNAPDKNISFVMADDGMAAKTGQRIVILHPEDTHANYNPAEYNRKRERNKQEEK